MDAITQEEFDKKKQRIVKFINCYALIIKGDI